MTTTILHDRQSLQEAFCSLAADAEEISLVSVRIADAPGGAPGVWTALRDNVDKVREVVTAVEHSDAAALEFLHRASVLRRANAGSTGLRTTVAMFRRPDASTALISSAPFPFHGFGSAVDVAIRVDGASLDPNIAELDLLIRDARRHAWVPYLHEIAAQEEQASSAREIDTAPTLSKVSTHAISKLSFLRDPARVADLRSKFVAEFIASATTIEARVGFHDGTFDTPVYWHAEFGIWASFDEFDNRYVHRFGTRDPDSSGALPMVVQVNVPLEGVSAAIGGDFVEDGATGRCYLAHRGGIGGSRGVGKTGFWQRARLASCLADRGDGVESKVALVCEVGNPRAVENVAAFVHEVARLKSVLAKDSAEDDEETEDSTEADEEPVDFLSIEDREEQSALVWGVLITFGALAKDEAVREAAGRLREDGHADYSRLSPKGALYEAILYAIEGGVKDGTFDRPRRNYVRAIISNVEDYTREAWETALVFALPEGDTVPREDAVRMAAEWSRETLGLEYARIRRDGKIDKGVRTALLALIRRGQIVSEGRAGVRLLGDDD